MPAPFACDMTAIPAEERGAHQALIRRLLDKTVQTISELPDGLAVSGYAARSSRSPWRSPPTEGRCCYGSPGLRA